MTMLQRILIGAVTAVGLVAHPGAGARAQTVQAGSITAASGTASPASAPAATPAPSAN